MSSTLPANEATLDLNAVISSNPRQAQPPAPRRGGSAPMADRAFAWASKGAALLTLGLLLAISGLLGLFGAMLSVRRQLARKA